MDLGLWIIFKLIQDSYKRMSDTSYFELVNDYSDYHAKRNNRNSQIERAEIISTWLEHDSSIADIGCGDGTIAAYLRDKGITSNICCYDLPTENLEIVRNKGFNVYPIDLEQMDEQIPNNKFDYILLVDVLEHLTKPHIVLKALMNKYKKGLIVSFPNSGYVPYRIQLLNGIFPRQSFTHLHFWTHKDFRVFCKVLNYHILDFKHERYASGIIPNLLYKRFQNVVCQHLFYLLK